jgi:hypothetical protein
MVGGALMAGSLGSLAVGTGTSWASSGFPSDITNGYCAKHYDYYSSAVGGWVWQWNCTGEYKVDSQNNIWTQDEIGVCPANGTEMDISWVELTIPAYGEFTEDVHVSRA